MKPTFPTLALLLVAVLTACAPADIDTAAGSADRGPSSGVPVCGNGACDSGEDCQSCGADCGPCSPLCGDGACDSGESCEGCEEDCGTCSGGCGDTSCGGVESCETCPEDCGTCATPSGCGNAACEEGEACASCADDCGACPSPNACGDELCGSAESCSSCPGDCGACPTTTTGCGDATCGGSESCQSCPADCGACPAAAACGDSACDAGETCSSCAADCGACPASARCGDSVCAGAESCLSCTRDCGACPAGTFDIWAPRLHNPQFVVPGGTFLAEVRAASTLSAGGWSAAVKNELRTWACSVSAVYGRINHKSEPGWRLTIKVPTDIAPELFDLRLSHASAGTASSTRGVQVLRSFEESFYVLHQTDHHLKDLNADNANGTSQNGSYQNGSVDGIKWGAKTVNLVNPRFVLITGDNAQLYFNASSWDGVTASAQRLELYKQALNNFRVPTLATTGNHCIGYPSYVSNAAWKAQYAKTMGERAFSYRLGSFYLLLHEWTQSDFASWASSDYAAAYADPTIKYRLLAQHFGDSNPVATAAKPAHLKVVGHNHAPKVVSTSPYRVLSAPSAQVYQKSAIYEFKRTSTGWTCPQAASHPNGNVFPMHGDWGAAKVVDTWQKANDGTQTSNSVTVKNALPFNFWNGRVKFVLAKGSYTVTGGTVEAAYHDDRGTKTVVVVKIDIPKSGSVTATVSRQL